MLAMEPPDAERTHERAGAWVPPRFRRGPATSQFGPSVGPRPLWAQVYWSLDGFFRVVVVVMSKR